MYMVKFGPTVLNFGYDFFLLVPFLGHPVYVKYNVLGYDDIHWYGHSLVLKMRNHNSGSRNQDGCQLVFSASLNGLMNRL